MADNPAEDATTGPVSIQIDLHNAWYNLMTRIAVYGPKMVNRGSAHLDAVDQITRMKSNRLP